MSNVYPPPMCTFTFKGLMAPVHCVLVDDNLLFAGTQEGKVHIWSLQTYRELLSLSVSSQPILSIHKTDSSVLFQDKEMSVSIWTYTKPEETPSGIQFKQIHCLKRGEPKLSFCKCIVFKSDLESHINKLGNAINSSKIENAFEDLSAESTERFHVTIPYDSKEITTFSVESRKKITVIDVTKGSDEKLSDVVMCMKLIQVKRDLYVILCTEEGHLTLYNLKFKRKECQIKLKSDRKVKKNIHISALQKDVASVRKEEELEIESLDLNTPDVPMAIDFDENTMRGLVGTNSSNLYCIKLYRNSITDVRNTKDSTSDVRNTKDSTSNVRNTKDSTSNVRNTKDLTSDVKNTKDLTSDVRNTKDSTIDVRNTKDSNSVEIDEDLRLDCSDSKLKSKRADDTSLKIKMVVDLKHSGVSCIAIRPDGRLFVLSFWDGNGIYIYSWSSLRCISYVDYVYASISQLYFYNSNMLAVACDGGKVSLWSFAR